MGKILVIAEKPSLGRSIAGAISWWKGEKFERQGKDRNTWLESDNYIVVSLVGHLYELIDLDAYFPGYDPAVKQPWDLKKLPFFPDDWKFKFEGKEKVQGLIKAANQQMNRKDVDAIYNAGDPDREGQRLVDEVLLYGLKAPKTIYRLWLPDTTNKTINDVVETQKTFSCIGKDKDGNRCPVTLWKENKFFESIGKKLTKTTAAALLTKGKAPLKGCVSKKTGKKYDCILTYDCSKGRPEFHLEFDHSGASGTVLGKCPFCGSDVAEGSKGYGCTNKDCSAVLWKTSKLYGNDVKISATAAKALLANGDSDLLYADGSSATMGGGTLMYTCNGANYHDVTLTFWR